MMEEEVFSLSVKSTKYNARELLGLIGTRDSISLPDLPIDVIQAFVDGKRNKIWEIEINGETLMHIHGTKGATKVLLGMLSDTGVDFLPLAPISKDNIKDFLEGKRDNLLQVEFKQEVIKEEEIPGNLGPTK
jgi:hypothetical protein